MNVEAMEVRLNKNKELSTRLIPDWSVGCRRYTPGPGYLEALQAPNVNVVYGGVTEVLPNGCKTSTGEVFELDTLICATGFDVSHRPRFPLVGKDGISDGGVGRAPPACGVHGTGKKQTGRGAVLMPVLWWCGVAVD